LIRGKKPRKREQYTAVDYLPAGGKTKEIADRRADAAELFENLTPAKRRSIKKRIVAGDEEAMRLFPDFTKGLEREKSLGRMSSAELAREGKRQGMSAEDILQQANFASTAGKMQDIWGGRMPLTSGKNLRKFMPELNPRTGESRSSVRRDRVLSSLGPGSPRKKTGGYYKRAPFKDVDLGAGTGYGRSTDLGYEDAVMQARFARARKRDTRKAVRGFDANQKKRRDVLNRERIVRKERDRAADDRDAALAAMRPAPQQAAVNPSVPTAPPVGGQSSVGATIPPPSSVGTSQPMGATPMPQLNPQQMAQAQTRQQSMTSIVQSNPQAYGVSLMQAPIAQTPVSAAQITVPMANVGTTNNMTMAQNVRKQIPQQTFNMT
jgi:hypothetical protein